MTPPFSQATTTTPAPPPAASRVPGALVHARGRDWVVLPDSTDELVLARPLDGDLEFVTGLFPDEISDPSFGDPVPGDGEIGDFASAGLLRTALRIAATSGAGPFRCMAGISVQPRQYQLVPLMMALRMDTVRLLIGDDVGIGKTVEAGLIARELLEQGTVTGLSVLCSPALAEQWRAELRDKFGLDAELVLPSTAARLHRGLEDPGQSIFARYPYTVVSTDFIKQRERREVFRRTCPGLLIVDEAHTCVGGGAGHQQRYELLRALAERPDRHVILVTATPHSGDSDAFARLTGLLDPALAALDPSLPAHRDRLARHMVQRRRRDIRSYLGQDTPFPSDRETREAPYGLDEPYAAFVTDVLAHAREEVRRPDGALRQRMSWWSVLALLRCVLSSPAAAQATLEARSGVAAARTPEEADTLGRATVLELTDDDAPEGVDAVPGTLLDDTAPGTAPGGAGDEDTTGGAAPTPTDPRLRAFATRAAALAGPDHDAKLRTLTAEVKALLLDGYDPIVFCRYIPTAEYVAAHLAAALGRAAHVEAVTGKLPADERRARIADLTERRGRHVLVATDCLSEGVNLQEAFGAVVHYDLSWNPTRHEQREGRVDRFGQRRDKVRAVTLYDTDTGVDGLVLDVLIRKHQDIARHTGVAVPVPDSGEGVLRALAQGLLLRGRAPEPQQLALDLGTDADLGSARDRLHREWDSTAERESRVLTKFAQSGMRPEDVQAELDELRQSLGEPGDVAAFTSEALAALGAPVIADTRTSGFTVTTDPLPPGLRHALGHYEDADQATAPGDPARPSAAGRTSRARATARAGGPGGRSRPREIVFRDDLPVAPGEHALVRTDPAVRAVARYVLDSALDPGLGDHDRPARRLGVVRTAAVTARTVLLLARYRFQLTLPRRPGARPGEPPRSLVAEDARLLAWRSNVADGARNWLTDEETAALLAATPDGNVLPELRDRQAHRAVAELPDVRDHLDAHGHDLADRLAASHQRVRQAAGERGRARGAAAARRITVDLAGHDVLGLFVYLPAPQGAR